MEIKLNYAAGLELPNGHALLPGYNQVTDAQVAALRAIPYTSVLEAAGMIEFVGDPVPQPAAAVKVPAKLRGLDLDVALAAIASCTDRAQLRKWLSTDSRAEVRAALQKRADELYDEQVKHGPESD